jgi:glycogen operon protein
MMERRDTTEGLPLPQGLTWIKAEQAYNFSLYSKHSEAVTLLLYRREDVTKAVLTVPLDPRKNKSGSFWHYRLPKARAQGAEFYAYSVSGPGPKSGVAWHGFDPAKVLLDPYAASVHFPDGFDRRAAQGPGSNAGRAPLGALSACEVEEEPNGAGLHHHDSEAVIYELHVRGFTMHPSSGLAPDSRGTYAGVTEKIPYLVDLGITVVELMPVFQCDPQEGSSWGYMPLNFFAPQAGYASPREGGLLPQRDFRDMVKALRAAGIEVVLDVVYNHTCEGAEGGPNYSYKGVDNSTYYMISDRKGDRYENFSGAGNTLHCANRQVRRLILDSLRHWARAGVDGFRFDLASVFTRALDGTINKSDGQLFSDIVADQALASRRLIAEPWDLDADQLGRPLPGGVWAQWNGRYRDDMRRFVRGDRGMVPALMRRLYGSDDLFPDNLMQSCRPWQSVNFITSHDGFTLYDLVSYDQKHNGANGHGNNDGRDDNYSWNCGWEGDAGLPAEVLGLRRRQAKNLCCLLLLSNGTPMFRAGDEFLQTQGGNNNPYNQDNDTTWLDWGRLDTHRENFRFFKRMLAFRKAHPSLGRSRFWRDDVRWHGVDAEPDLSPDSHCLAYCLSGASQQDDDVYVMVNVWWQPLDFVFQGERPSVWRRVVDTSLAGPHDIAEAGVSEPVGSSHYVLQGRSIAVFIRPRV